MYSTGLVCSICGTSQASVLGFLFLLDSILGLAGSTRAGLSIQGLARNALAREYLESTSTVHGIELHLLLLELLLPCLLFLHFPSFLLLHFQGLLTQTDHDLFVVHDLGAEVFAIKVTAFVILAVVRQADY